MVIAPPSGATMLGTYLPENPRQSRAVAEPYDEGVLAVTDRGAESLRVVSSTQVKLENSVHAHDLAYNIVELCADDVPPFSVALGFGVRG